MNLAATIGLEKPPNAKPPNAKDEMAKERIGKQIGRIPYLIGGIHPAFSNFDVWNFNRVSTWLLEVWDLKFEILGTHSLLH
ncbi:MAG: hypothetical protein WD941_05485 [Opitutus sp.]